MDDLKKNSQNHNKLKAAIRSHSAPLSDESAQQQANPPYIIEDSRLTKHPYGPRTDAAELHPYVSCLLFFEEHIEAEYEAQVEHLHHIFQRNGIPEGLIAPGFPRVLLDDPTDLHVDDKNCLSKLDDKMILRCINHDVNPIPVLAIWAVETGRAEEIELQRRMRDEVRRIQTELAEFVGSEDASCGMYCGMLRLSCRYGLDKIWHKFCCGCNSRCAMRTESKMFKEKYDELLNEDSAEQDAAICCGCVKLAPREKVNDEIHKIAEEHVESEYKTKLKREANSSISDHLEALEAVQKYKRQHRIMHGDYHRSQPLAREWHLLGTPGHPYDGSRLKTLADVVLQGGAEPLRDVIPRNVLAVLDGGRSCNTTKDTLRCVHAL